MALALLNTNNTQVVALVNAIFNVAPGYTYLNNFSGFAAQNGIAKTADALAVLAGQTDAAFTTALVANLGLTGAAATAGAAYVTGRLNAKATQGAVALEAVTFFASAAAKADATYGAAATAFAATVERSEIYSTNSANTSTDVAVLANASAGKLPQDFTLTSGDNAFTGGNGNDTFGAASGTYDVARDKLDGGAGLDKLSVAMTAADITPAAKNIETLSFTMTDGTAGTADTSTVTLDSTKVTGVTTVEFFNYTGSTAGTEDTAEVTGVTTETARFVQGSNYNATVTLKDATGSADSTTVDLEDAAAKLLTVDGVETVTINAVGAATAGNVLSSGLDADAMTKLVVTGSAKVNLGAVEDTGKAITIDASANLGGVTAKFAQNPLADTKAFKLTGTSGSDNFTFDPTDIDGDTGTTRYYSVDFGAGTDTLTFATAVTGLTAADLKKGLTSFTGYETVSFKGDEHAGVNLLTTGLQGKTLSVNNAAGATFSNALSGVVVNVDTAVTSNAIKVSFAGAGSKDATLNLKGKAAILEAGSGTGSFTGVGNLTITNTATTSTDVALTDIDDFNGAKLTLSGNGGIDLSSDLLSTSTVEVAGSAMTDSINVKTSASGTLVNTGAGVDTIVINGLAVQDEVHAGAGNDTISLTQIDGVTNATNASVITDIIDGGAGTDTVNIMGDDDWTITTDLTGATFIDVESLVIDDAIATKTHVVTITSAQSVQFAGDKLTTATLTDSAGTDVAPTVTVKMAAADTAVSGTSLVDTFKAAASQVGFTVTGGKANDTLDLTNLTSANWGATNAKASDVDASTEWFFDNATDTLTVWDDVASHAVAIKLTGVATVTVATKIFTIATLDA